MATASSFVVAVAVIIMCAGAMAQAPGPSPYARMAPGPSSYAGMPSGSMGPAPAAEDCFSYVLNMSDCLSYVQTGSNVTVPDKPCCPELAGLLDSHPLCLCALIGNAGSYGVDVTKALTLPGACGIPTPSISLCPGSFSTSYLQHLSPTLSFPKLYVHMMGYGGPKVATFFGLMP